MNVWQVGQDDDGIQRAISYQITPAGIYYRRDIAKEVFGTDDPDEVGKLFKDYPTILETAQTLKDAGYRIFSSDAEMNVFSGDSAWVVDGTLNVDQSRIDYMDLCVDLYQNDLTAYASQWSTPWYQAMAGEVPILTADIQSNADDSVNVWDADQFAEATKGLDTTTVFAFGLPSWGVLTMRDNVGETSGFGVIGFLDDYLKVVLRRSDGLLAWQKMILQIIVTGVFAVYMVKYSGVALTMLIPFSGGKYLDLGWLAIPVLFFAVVGTVNGTNFTDGLDGLASSVTIMVATFFSVVAIGTNAGIAPITCAVVGALLGFLLFNVYPASVFMGDTGSLALGGFVVSTAYMMQMPLFILIVGLIYLVEVLSVIIQVTYFKKTGGKRIFRMAPIHHHFELGGWSETRVVAVFSITTAILCLIALLAM